MFFVFSIKYLLLLNYQTIVLHPDSTKKMGSEQFERCKNKTSNRRDNNHNLLNDDQLTDSLHFEPGTAFFIQLCELWFQQVLKIRLNCRFHILKDEVHKLLLEARHLLHRSHSQHSWIVFVCNIHFHGMKYSGL